MNCIRALQSKGQEQIDHIYDGGPIGLPWI